MLSGNEFPATEKLLSRPSRSLRTAEFSLACGASSISDPKGRPIPVGSKAAMLIQPGSVVRIETSGGGGYGDPANRDPALRAADEEGARG